MQDRKWFLLTCLFSLRICKGSKIPKSCFLSKITHLSTHSWHDQSGILLIFSKMYFVRDRELLLLTQLLSLRIFQC